MVVKITLKNGNVHVIEAEDIKYYKDITEYEWENAKPQPERVEEALPETIHEQPGGESVVSRIQAKIRGRKQHL